MKVHVFHLFSPDFWFGLWRVYSGRAGDALIQIAALVLIYLLLKTALFRVLDGLLRTIVAREKRAGVPVGSRRRLTTLEGLCKSIIGYTMLFIFGVLILKAMGFDIVPLVTTAGVVGLAVGFGAQKLVKDSIAGFFIVVDNLFGVGDTVTIGTVTGRVVEMGMRVTTILDQTGRLHMFANGDIGLVSNLSRNPINDFVELSVAVSTDLKLLQETVNAAGDRLLAEPNQWLTTAPRFAGITAVTATAITCHVTLACDPRNLTDEQMRVRSALLQALADAKIALA